MLSVVALTKGKCVIQKLYKRMGSGHNITSDELKGGEQVAKVGGLRPLTVYCDNS